MRSSKKDVLFLIGLLGILAAVCSYCLIYRPVTKKADALEQENQKLQAEITDRMIKMNNRDSYLTDTESMERKIDEVYRQFPVDVREEDGILLAESEELASSMMISSITIGALEPVILPDAVEGKEEENPEGNEERAGNALTLMKRNVTFHYLVSYEGLKKGINNIGAQENRMSIESLTASYDEATGLVTGLISVDMYCIPGQPGKEYAEPDLPSVAPGTDNIFGSIEFYEQADFTEDTVYGKEEDEGEEEEEVR